MLHVLIRWLLTVILGLFAIYLLLPSPSFPEPPTDAQQSQEPGDVLELDVRRSYFTDWPRQQVMDHYVLRFQHPGIFAFLPSYRLNYPPEESLWYVYDPLKATYLEEIVYPFRESFYVSGYEPGPNDDKIAFEGRPYFSKITVKYYSSPLWVRILVSGLSVIALIFVWNGWVQELRLLWRDTSKALFKKGTVK